VDASGWLGVLDPQGPVAAAERTILVNATLIMCAVIVPVMVLAVAFTWWFRAGNPWARRIPDWAYSGAVEVTVWSIPILVVLFLAGIGWIGSHDLDPRRPLPSAAPPLRVQVVSLDWKWLFVYPDLGVATVDRLVVPAGVPVRFQLTSATVMNSFFVPQLGSQIYTMGGMVTQLNLQADRPGVYMGRSTNFSGDGFASMQFETAALAAPQFQAWLSEVRSQGVPLDAARYTALARPGVNQAPLAFGSVLPHLFEQVVEATAAGVSRPAGATASGDLEAPRCKAS
jgi:cytochrome o ubiquinol oxidase subunit 2